MASLTVKTVCKFLKVLTQRFLKMVVVKNIRKYYVSSLPFFFLSAVCSI